MKNFKFAHYVPDNILTNDHFAQIVETSDEWIEQRTGIKTRHHVIDEKTTDLAYKAVKQLDYQGSDAIIFCTFTPDHFTPSCASVLQKKLDIEVSACFDLQAACTGFIYGLQVAYSLIASKQYSKIIIVGSEVISKVVDMTDRNTCIIFGDGAGAFVMDRNNYEMFKAFHFKSISDVNDSLYCGVVEKPITDQYLHMKGQDVFKFATVELEKNVRTILADNNLQPTDIDYFVFHQANQRIIEMVARKLKISSDQIYVNISRYGNTSSASIPICVSEMQAQGLIKPGQRLLLAGFGAGLTLGSTIIDIKGE